MKQEIRRYLGCANVTDSRLDVLIDKALEQVTEAANPKYLFETFDITVDENGVWCADTYFKSKSLSNHLKNCKQAVLICITLGTQVDRLIDRTAVTDIALASCMQSAAAALIENELDKIEPICCQNKPHPFRFSAGYGDFDIKYQTDFLRLLSAYKIGLSMTQSFQLVPTKSVTAIIGLTE